MDYGLWNISAQTNPNQKRKKKKKKEPKQRTKKHNYFVTIIMPVAGSNLLLEKVSDSPNFSSELFFPNSVLMCSFLYIQDGVKLA